MSSRETSLTSWLLASPPVEWVLKVARELLIGTLRQGPIPKHVAFVMDGNRRYAKERHIEAIEGHSLGFEALARVLEICYKCGVKVVTVYAFSIENFNRPKSEVSGLMKMAKVKLEQLCQHGELLDRYGACIRVLGERSLIPPDVLPFVDKAVEMTAKNKNAVLNICFPYTSRAEMTAAIKGTIDEFSAPPTPLPTSFDQERITNSIRSNQLKKSKSSSSLGSYAEAAIKSPKTNGVNGVNGNKKSTVNGHENEHSEESEMSIRNHVEPTQFKDAELITAETLDSHMYTAGCPPLDLFIRTSGVTRLSDFMMWQSHQNTHVFFLSCYWPDFDLWHMVPILLEWQWRQKNIERESQPGRRPKFD